MISRTIYRGSEGYFDESRTQVCLLDRDSGSVSRLTTEATDHTCPEWGDDDTLYYTRKTDYRTHEIIAHDVRTDTVETVVDSITEADAWYPDLAATPARLAYTYGPTENRSMRQTQIAVLDRSTGDTTVVTESLNRTVARSTSIQWDPSGERVYFVVPDAGGYTLFATEGDDTAHPTEVARSATGTITEFDVSSNGVCLLKSEWDSPGDLYYAAEADDELDRVRRANGELLDERRLSEPEELRFEAEDGTEIQGWILTPPGFDPDGTYPLILEVHGGPHAMWTTSGTMWHEFQTLAAAGYVVCWCNPHGSTGYGQEFMQAIKRDWGGIDYRDIMTWLDVVVEHEYVDEEALFVTGGSYGGYLTAWIVSHTDRFAGAVAQRGVYDLASFDGSSTCHKLMEWELDATPWEDPELYQERSPVAHAHEVSTPTLLLHSEEDYVAPINNAEMLFTFLKRSGVDTEFVRYPREGHELSRGGEPAHVIDRLERIVGWFDDRTDTSDQ